MNFKAGLGMPLMLASALFLSACHEEQAAAATQEQAEPEYERITLKVAFTHTEEHPQYLALAALSDHLREATQGRCQMEIYPNALLGPQTVAVEKVQAGQVDMAVVGGPILESWEPKFGLINLPYLFRDQNQLLKVVSNQELMGPLFQDLEHHNLKVLTALYGGLRNVYTQAKEINDINDMRGLKLRVLQSENTVKLIYAMGARGVPMEQSEVSAAIAEGEIDGAENNVVAYYELKHHKVAPYYNLTKHAIMAEYLIINAQTYLELPREVKDFFDRNLPQWQVYEFDLFAESEIEALNKAQIEGMVTIDTDVREFRQRAAAVVHSHTYDARERVFLDKINELIQEQP